MNEKEKKKVSKFLSLVLRHEPEKIGIELDEAGWTDVAALRAAMAERAMPITQEDLAEVVATNEKKRFAFSEDGTRIRASQGHSVEVSLGYEPQEPPAVLYHGTGARSLESIRMEGIHKGERHHVHLSKDVPTATQVGGRHGRPVVLVVRADKMTAAGFQFFVSENGVWLTDHVPAEFLEFPHE